VLAHGAGRHPALHALAQAQGHDDTRLVARIQRPQRIGVEVVVVVVRDQHEIDLRHRLQCEGRRRDALRARPLQRRRALRPPRIGEDVEPRHLHQQRGVADGGDARLVALHARRRWLQAGGQRHGGRPLGL
jgi:hypothetical protein